ncbi:hypothetical protein PCE1_000228 [Barthelona sp. PCE]
MSVPPPAEVDVEETSVEIPLPTEEIVMEAEEILPADKRDWDIPTVRKEIDNWTLAGDLGVLEVITKMSEELLNEVSTVKKDVDKLNHETAVTTINFRNTLNEFRLLTHHQFIESRVYQLEELDENSENEEEVQSKELSRQEKQNIVLPRYRTALSNAFNIFGIDPKQDLEKESEEEPKSHRSYFVDYREQIGDLAHLLGTREWVSDPDVGLTMEVEEPEVVEDSEDVESQETTTKTVEVPVEEAKKPTRESILAEFSDEDKDSDFWDSEGEEEVEAEVKEEPKPVVEQPVEPITEPESKHVQEPKPVKEDKKKFLLSFSSDEEEEEEIEIMQHDVINSPEQHEELSMGKQSFLQEGLSIATPTKVVEKKKPKKKAYLLNFSDTDSEEEEDFDFDIKKPSPKKPEKVEKPKVNLNFTDEESEEEEPANVVPPPAAVIEPKKIAEKETIMLEDSDFTSSEEEEVAVAPQVEKKVEPKKPQKPSLTFSDTSSEEEEEEKLEVKTVKEVDKKPSKTHLMFVDTDSEESDFESEPEPEPVKKVVKVDPLAEVKPVVAPKRTFVVSESESESEGEDIIPTAKPSISMNRQMNTAKEPTATPLRTAVVEAKSKISFDLDSSSESESEPEHVPKSEPKNTVTTKSGVKLSGATALPGLGTLPKLKSVRNKIEAKVPVPKKPVAVRPKRSSIRFSDDEDNDPIPVPTKPVQPRPNVVQPPKPTKALRAPSADVSKPKGRKKRRKGLF